MDRTFSVKRILPFILIFFCVPSFGQTGFSFGVGGEANIITLEDRGFALGGGIQGDYRFGPVFAAGFHAGAFYDLNELFSIENRALFRWYFVRHQNTELFFQGDAGVLLSFRNFDLEKSRGAPAFGLTLGTRIHFTRHWFIEPYIQGGYPYIAGAGIIIGAGAPVAADEPSKAGGKPENETPRAREKIAENTDAERPVKTADVPAVRNEMPRREADLPRGEERMIFRQVESVPEIAALSMDPYIYFASNTAAFGGLPSKTIENNYRIIRAIAGFLNSSLQYSLIIEGHANPVSNSPDEEKTLSPLSVQRAERVANALIYFGVDRKRLIIAGSGGVKALVPWTDRAHWNLNRRVEFLLFRQGGNE
ncbi:MAG: OmpA family protein [Spirochaetaceae bacterium]|jgi:outer membrane protein OmpA-like peptidoglycan-associated protein|nr:OmpA family protein [Spirochaetaceae bacterium]